MYRIGSKLGLNEGSIVRTLGGLAGGGGYSARP